MLGIGKKIDDKKLKKLNKKKKKKKKIAHSPNPILYVEKEVVFIAHSQAKSLIWLCQ